ncbi:MAG: nuclear transport factor 2 family protein [Chthoniobacterales bacterium]
MKKILLNLTASAFLTAPLIFAQDPTVAVPTEQSEAAAQGLATPSVHTLPHESLSPKSKPVPEATTSATPAAKKSVAPAKKMGAEATLRDLETKWVGSVATHDPSVAQQLLADDYAGVSSRGQLMNKRALLAQIKRDSDVYASAKIKKMEVRVFGNSAVVIGNSVENGKDSRGASFDRAYRWTDTWVLRNGGWQCVASQSAQIAK